MSKPNRYFDVAILLLLCYMSGITVYYHVNGVSDLSIRNYIGFIFLVFVIGAKFIVPHKFRLSVLLLLGLGLFNIASFTLYKFTAAVGYGDNEETADVINPVIFLLLIVYSIVNWRFIKSYYTKNDIEAKQDESKLVEFYYEKFKSCSNEEFNSVLAAYNQYPTEAQKAIEKLIVEKR